MQIADLAGGDGITKRSHARIETSIEAEHAGQVVEQVVRPTGLVDPEVEVRRASSQVDDVLTEINRRVERDERVLITTLTKRMAEDLTDYLQFMKDRGAGPLPQDVSAEVPAMRRMAFHFFPFPEGAISAIAAEPLPEAALHELRRLADAFAFAYTRYLDLKQAEAGT